MESIIDFEREEARSMAREYHGDDGPGDYEMDAYEGSFSYEPPRPTFDGEDEDVPF